MTDPSNQTNNEKRNTVTLTQGGAVIYALLVTLLCSVAGGCMRTDAENAIFTFFAPIFLFAASYFCVALLVHRQNVLYAISAVGTVICVSVLTFSPLRALICLAPFAAALTVHALTLKKRMTHSGVICAATAVQVLFASGMFCVLSLEKYGAVGMHTFIRAYDSFIALVMKLPEENLELLRSYLSDPAYAELVTQERVNSYAKAVAQLSELMKMTVYSVPSLFLCICAIGGFITTVAAHRHRRLVGAPDTLGRFALTPISAVMYIIMSLISVFISSDSALYITLSTVSSVIGLGLALVGLVYAVAAWKRSERRTLYTVLFIATAALMPSVLVSMLSLVGAWRTVIDAIPKPKQDSKQ